MTSKSTQRKLTAILSAEVVGYSRPKAALEDYIAFAMEVPKALLPWLPELLADLPDLSGATNDVLTLLRQFGLPKGAEVLDLGCGRGEIAIAVADDFDALVTGIDGMAPFLETAREQAVARGLEGRCQFVHGNLRDVLHQPMIHDAVLMIALGPILGDAAATVAALRRVVRPGGLIVIDDGYLVGPPPDEPGWEAYATLEETERRLVQHGDHIGARLDRRASMEAFDQVAADGIERQAETLVRRRPEWGDMLREFLAGQYWESSLWNTDLMPAIWCLRRV